MYILTFGQRQNVKTHFKLKTWANWHWNNQIICLSEEISEELYLHVVVSHLRILGGFAVLLWVIIEPQLDFSHVYYLIPHPQTRYDGANLFLITLVAQCPCERFLESGQGVSWSWEIQFFMVMSIFSECVSTFVEPKVLSIPIHGSCFHGWMWVPKNTGILWEINFYFKLISPSLCNKWCLHDLLTSVTIC